jgi:hypothetical protein
MDNGVGSLLASSNNGSQMGQLNYERTDVSGLYYLEEFVGCIVLQTANGGRGIEECKPFFLAERYDFIELEALSLFINKILTVTKKHFALDTPVVVDKVRIIEVNTPPFPLRWKTA